MAGFIERHPDRRRRPRLTDVLVAIGMALFTAAAAWAGAPPTTVGSFAIDRYLGRWHEVARMPNRFQDDCVGDVTAEYATGDDGLITVVNTCREADGRFGSAIGVARTADGAAAGRLEVTFLRLLGMPIWLTAADYWVIGLDPDYRWAVVGTPSREYGWILARQPTLDRPTLVDLARLLGDQGYDACAFVLSNETTATRPTRLCDL